LLHVLVTSNYQQADISLHGHDVFSATAWDPILFIFAVFNFRHFVDKRFNKKVNQSRYRLGVAQRVPGS